MTEHVDVLDLGVAWEPNAPSAMLVTDDHGTTALALHGHPDDPDDRCVVLVWSGTRSAWVTASNDEAVPGRLAHHMVLLKECVAEVVAEEVAVHRVKGTTLEAAVLSMAR